MSYEEAELEFLDVDNECHYEEDILDDWDLISYLNSD